MLARTMGQELNELYVPEVHFEFPFSLTNKLTMVFLSLFFTSAYAFINIRTQLVQNGIFNSILVTSSPQLEGKQEGRPFTCHIAFDMFI